MPEAELPGIKWYAETGLQGEILAREPEELWCLLAETPGRWLVSGFSPA